MAEWRQTEQIGTRIDYQAISQQLCEADTPETRDLVRLAEIEAEQVRLTREAYEIIRRRIDADMIENTRHRQICEVARREARALEKQSA